MPGRPFEKGNKIRLGSKNPNAGRPSSKVKQLAKSRTLRILKRLADIADGKDLEQVVNENGESIKIPSPIREQIKAGEVVLKVAGDLGPESQVNIGGEGSRLVFIHPESK